MREFLIDPKRDPDEEYTIHLFEFCNLRCASVGKTTKILFMKM